VFYIIWWIKQNYFLYLAKFLDISAKLYFFRVISAVNFVEMTFISNKIIRSKNYIYIYMYFVSILKTASQFLY